MINRLPQELLAAGRTSLLTAGCMALTSASLVAFTENESDSEEFEFRLPGPAKLVYATPAAGLHGPGRADGKAELIADPPGFVSPPLKEFPSALLDGFVGLIDSDNLVPAIIGASAAGASALADDSTKNYFQSRRRVKEVGDIGDTLGNGFVLAGITGALLATSYSGENQKFRAMSFSLAQSFVMTEVIVQSIKAFKRPLPAELRERALLSLRPYRCRVHLRHRDFPLLRRKGGDSRLLRGDSGRTQPDREAQALRERRHRRGHPRLPDRSHRRKSDGSPGNLKENDHQSRNRRGNQGRLG